ncbi:MAG: high-affinity iron transporter [Patiriisocius sp.]|jgi:high-affinity iron transporter
MDTFIQAMVMAFREGLEGFLIIVILLKFLDKIAKPLLKKQVWRGAYAGIATSLVMGLLLFFLSEYIGGLKTTAKLWESVASLFAVALVTTFIIWMIKHGANIKKEIEGDISKNLTGKGVLLLVMFMVAREGTEIAIFSFAGKYEFLPIAVGLALSLLVVVLINFAFIKVNLKVLFAITLGYLILQAGYLLGYGVHEGLSAIKDLGWIEKDSALLNKAFNVYDGVLNHKKGILGLPLNVLFGWYSKPEWIQFIMQYTYTFGLFAFWRRTLK